MRMRACFDLKYHLHDLVRARTCRHVRMQPFRCVDHVPHMNATHLTQNFNASRDVQFEKIHHMQGTRFTFSC
jgi:hypothetical protein